MYLKMKADVKKEWIRRLRSGRYKQAQRQLCRVDAGNKKSYCCLGVLYKQRRHRDPSAAPAIHAGDGYLRAKMLANCGFTDSAQKKLADLNDAGLSFSDIADWIERNL